MARPLVEEVLRRLAAARPPFLVGIAGSVAVGKSTLAAELQRGLEARGVSTEVLGTDAFLFPNDVLRDRGLTLRKGFPESFDRDALAACLDAFVARAGPVTTPVYSHVIYDRVPGAEQVLEPADVLVIEGVNALQPPVRERLDLAVYVDTDEAVVRTWFVERFLMLSEAAEEDDASFYRMFAGMTADERRTVAEGTWDAINGVNLHLHIAPTKATADVVVRKDCDHAARVLISS